MPNRRQATIFLAGEIDNRARQLHGGSCIGKSPGSRGLDE
jgi:DNA-binding HxlR family transcriptional regulator